jgi:hypothetical protein
MNIEELEAKVRSLEKLVTSSQEQTAVLQRRLTRLEDVEQIKKLQRCYGYYFERGMNAEVAELFSESADARIYFRGIGGFAGANVKASWTKHLPGKDPSKYLHLLSMTSGIVDVDPDGLTAKGRWYGYGNVAIPMEEISPDTINHFGFAAVYECEYVKENGVWKIQVLDVAMLYQFKNPGFVDPKRFDLMYANPLDDVEKSEDFRKMFDFPERTPTNYPSAFTLPFHFKHPVTDRETSEIVRNEKFGFGTK